ncbi:oxidoreductase [Asaia sp. W19]|uniref:oxidoreductase n=2 Tax=unclassified Asaia TaxID=2685023 RepID=UPI001F412AE7|nr:oxidoreductase [Asaia sp. W19]
MSSESPHEEALPFLWRLFPEMIFVTEILMEEPVLRAVLVGFGYVSRTFHAPFLSTLPQWHLHGIVSRHGIPSNSAPATCQIYTDPETAFADPDVDLVVIATPNDTHFPLACAALRAGKHVVLEKPFALSLDEAREIIATAEQHDRHLCVFHNRRWDSDYLSIRAAIADGTIGRVTHFESTIDRFRPLVRDRWRESNARGAGVLYDIGPHLIDQALQIFGLPEQVYASLALQRDNAQSDDWAHILLEYGATRVILHTGSLAAEAAPRFVVHGTGGTLIKRLADPQEAQLREGMIPGHAGWGEDPDATEIYLAESESRPSPALKGDQRELYRQLARALTGKAGNPIRPVEALAVMAVIEAAVQSAHEKRAVPLALSPEEKRHWHDQASAQAGYPTPPPKAGPQE